MGDAVSENKLDKQPEKKEPTRKTELLSEIILPPEITERANTPLADISSFQKDAIRRALYKAIDKGYRIYLSGQDGDTFWELISSDIMCHHLAPKDPGYISAVAIIHHALGYVKGYRMGASEVRTQLAATEDLVKKVEKLEATTISLFEASTQREKEASSSIQSKLEATNAKLSTLTLSISGFNFSVPGDPPWGSITDCSDLSDLGV